MTLKDFENSLCTPCVWCEGQGRITTRWCITCGGSGLARTAVPGKVYPYLKTARNRPPYLSGPPSEELVVLPLNACLEESKVRLPSPRLAARPKVPKAGGWTSTAGSGSLPVTEPQDK